MHLKLNTKLPNHLTVNSKRKITCIVVHFVNKNFKVPKLIEGGYIADTDYFFFTQLAP